MTALLFSALCVVLNAFFVAAEFAIVRVRTTQLRPRARRGERRAVAAEAVLSKLDRYLSVTQVGITVASLGLGWVGEPALVRLGDQLAIAVTGESLGRVGHVAVDVVGLGTLTFVHVLVGELVPKAIAIRHSESMALATAVPLRIANVVFWPALWILEHAQRGFLRLVKVDPDLTEGSFSEEEILGILASTTRRSPVAADRQLTVKRVLRFAGRPVKQIMVPRVDIVALPIDASGERAYQTFKRRELSRILLYRDTIDEIAGYLYAKDFLFEDGARERESLHGLEREVLFVPESRDGLGVVRDMQRTQVPFAVVVDEYGGTSGILTIEDLVEEVFGELRDELDAERERVVPLNPTAWDVDARATVDELRDAGVPIEELDPGDTIGKLVLDRLGHLPRVGDLTQLTENVAAEVVATGRRRIRRLCIRARSEGQRTIPTRPLLPALR